MQLEVSKAAISASVPIEKFNFEIISGVSSSNQFELEEFGLVLKKTKKKTFSNLIDQWEAVIDTSKIAKINLVMRMLRRSNPSRWRFLTNKSKIT